MRGDDDGREALPRSADGVVVVLAGPSHDTATYGADALAHRARREGHGEPSPVPPEWIERLRGLDPAAVYLAHDRAVWQP